VLNLARANLLQTIRKFSKTIDTDPVLLDILMEGLHAWLHTNDAPSPNLHPAAYRRLVRKQTTLRWQQLLNGRWTTKWARLQERFVLRSYDPVPANLAGTKWTSIFIDILWTSFRQ
jgi:hypothetical protein